MAKARVTGIAGFEQALDEMSAKLYAGVQDACAISAERVRSHVVIDINEQKPNPDYAVPEGATGRRAHIPAPPGGPPNSDTGNLSSRYTSTSGRQGSRIFGLVVAGVLYAFWLEYGTSRMLARPHLRNRFDEEKPHFVDRLKRVASEAAKAVSKGGRRSR